MNTIENRMKEVIKKKHDRKMYHFKDMSTPHIILYPIMVLLWIYDNLSQKLIDKIRSLYKWNEKRAYRIITEEVVRHGDLDQKDGTIYYYWRRWNSWWFDKYHCKLIDRAFCHKFNKQITEYFVNDYQIAGYTKEVDDTDSDWYEFTFTKKA